MIEIRELTAEERARMARSHRRMIDAMPPRDQPSEGVVRMAASMIDIAAASGGCTPADLIEAGFTPDDIARDSEAAREFANRKAERKVA
ncbi:hypothetical protein [Jiella marina]|uniref:hypothetical protein n=1 Tax=Jiella sp. LLJ827 TaxID=2917712 RepID=UPI0021019E0B|nr:hypothetical protein [Jiella sp. LLJ827]MCQ0987523.1 hypothetical protein [Jiella sp. LLJ827]